jgi:hypothetical protein
MIPKIYHKQELGKQHTELKDLWNSDIDKRIEQERRMFESRVKHLNTLKIS